MPGVLEQIAVILVAGIVLKTFADRIKFPAIVLFVLGGTLLATYGILDMSAFESIPRLVREIALIIVVFSSAFHLRMEEIAKQSRNILWLSSFGVLLTALIIAFFTLQMLPIGILSAAFLGVLLCGTDPAAISSGPQRKSKILTILSAESLFNQPLTVILPLLLLDFVTKPEMAWINVPKFFSLIIVGAVVGVVSAYAGQKILKRAEGKHEEIVGLMIAIGSYVLAELLFGSGILAVAICSVLLTSSNIPEKAWLGHFNKELAFLFTVFVFIMLGAEFTIENLFFTRLEIFAIIVALIAARLIAAFIALFRSDLNVGEILRIGLIAPKGMGPAALAPLLLLYPAAIAPTTAGFIVKIVYLAIIVSVLFSLIAMSLFVAKPSEEELIKEALEEKKRIERGVA